MSLNEYSDEDLAKEQKRRKGLRSGGLCTYCRRDGTTSPCKMFQRHAEAVRALQRPKKPKRVRNTCGYCERGVPHRSCS